MSEQIDITVGDKVQVLYIHDTHKDNGRIGIVSWVNVFNFYPNRDNSVIEKKAQITITFDNNDTLDTNYNKNIKKL